MEKMGNNLDTAGPRPFRWQPFRAPCPSGAVKLRARVLCVCSRWSPWKQRWEVASGARPTETGNAWPRLRGRGGCGPWGSRRPGATVALRSLRTGCGGVWRGRWWSQHRRELSFCKNSVRGRSRFGWVFFLLHFTKVQRFACFQSFCTGSVWLGKGESSDGGNRAPGLGLRCRETVGRPGSCQMRGAGRGWRSRRGSRSRSGNAPTALPAPGRGPCMRQLI